MILIYELGTLDFEMGPEICWSAGKNLTEWHKIKLDSMQCLLVRRIDAETCKNTK